MGQLSRVPNFGDDPEALIVLADEVEAAAQGLLALSTRASVDLPGGLSLTQLRALSAADELGSCSLGALADALMISVSSASRLVDRLVASGVLDRRISDVSRREVRLQVTPSGRRLLRRHVDARRALFAEALAQMSATEVRALLRGLRALQRHVR